MPITATFNADFSKFATAVAEAQTKLITFEGNATKVAASLSAMEKSISGVPIVQAATVAAEAVARLGGASKLTYDELQRLGGTAQDAVEKMRALGQGVPTGIQNLADRARGASEDMLRLSGATKETHAATTGWGGALSTAQGVLGALGIQASISGVIALGQHVFETASQTHNMAQQLGISAEAVQGFTAAAKQGGATFEDVGSAITKMNKNLSIGDGGTIDALKKAGLEFQTIRSMKPEDAFLAITDAAAKMSDPMEQTEVTLKLLGNTSAALLPAIKDGFREAADAAEKMGNRSVDSLRRAADAWDKFKNHVVTVSGNVLATVIDEGAEIASGWEVLIDGLKHFGESAEDAKKRFAGMRDALVKASGYYGPVEDLAKGIHQTKEEADAAEAAYKKWAEGTEELKAAGDGWQGTLDTIDGEVVEAIKYYLAAGVAQNKLAAAYDLTDTQVKSVASSVTALALQQQDLAKHQADADAIRMISFSNQIKAIETMAAANAKAYGTEEQIAALQRLEAQELALTKSVYENITSEKDRMKLIEQYGAKHAEITAKILDLEGRRTKVVNDQVIAELEAQKKLDEAYRLSASGGIAQVETAYEKLQRALDELHAKKVTGIDQTNQENLLFKQYSDATNAAAKSADGLRDAEVRKNAEVAKVPGVMAAAEAATKSYAAANQSSGATGGQFQTPSFGGYLKPVQSFSLPSYADGGVGNFGAGTLALLHGLEAIVPLDKVPTAPGNASLPSLPGAMLAGADRRRAPGGATITNNFYVNGTAEEAARKIADLVMRSVLDGTKMGA